MPSLRNSPERTSSSKAPNRMARVCNIPSRVSVAFPTLLISKVCQLTQKLPGCHLGTIDPPRSISDNGTLVMKALLRAFLVLAVAAAALLGQPSFNGTQQVIPVVNGDVAGLISAINTLNTGGGGFILLAPNGTYNVSGPSDWWYGPDAFPAIQ